MCFCHIDGGNLHLPKFAIHQFHVSQKKSNLYGANSIIAIVVVIIKMVYCYKRGKELL